MSLSWYDQGNREKVHKFMRESLEWTGLIISTLEKMDEHYYGIDYQEAISQRFGDYDIYDAYAFLVVHTMIVNGEVGMAKIHLGEYPEKDKKVTENNQMLSKLGDGFETRFCGKTADTDGYIRVRETIELCVKNDLTGERSTLSVGGQFPLEVGYCKSAKVHLALNLYKRLARWPYNQEDIYFFCRVEDGQPAPG